MVPIYKFRWTRKQISLPCIIMYQLLNDSVSYNGQQPFHHVNVTCCCILTTAQCVPDEERALWRCPPLNSRNEVDQRKEMHRLERLLQDVYHYYGATAGPVQDIVISCLRYEKKDRPGLKQLRNQIELVLSTFDDTSSPQRPPEVFHGLEKWIEEEGLLSK
jgi:hypothetical protein